MESILSVGPWVAVAACAGWILVQIGERSEDRRRRVGELAAKLADRKFPKPIVEIFNEYAIGDRSGAVAALVSFVKLMKDDKQREALWKEFQKDSLDLAINDPELRPLIEAALNVKVVAEETQRKEIYEEVAAELEAVTGQPTASH